MKRREFIQGGIGLLTLGAVGRVFGATPCPPELAGTVPIPCPAPTPEGPISQLAASMLPGTWARLTGTSGLSTIVTNYLAGAYGTQQSGTRGFFEFATGGIWINDHHELHFRGSGHQSNGIHIRYKESTGEWTVLNTFSIPGWEHQYDHTAYDQSRNIMYATTPESRTINKWSYVDGSGSWNQNAATRIGQLIIAEGMEYFPDANSGQGGLVHYGAYAPDGSQTGGLRLSTPSVDSWSWIGGNYFPSNGERYHLNAVYLPSQKIILFGGGNADNTAAAMDSNGNVTRRNNLPTHWGPRDNNGMGTVVADSITGRIFFVSATNNTLYEHNYSSDSWNAIGSLPSTGPRSFVTMIPTYGVIHYVTGESTDTSPSEWIYKL